MGYKNLAIPPRLQQEETQSSSAGDYRSVIDDLTVEIQKLKEELKRYKQRGPDLLRKDQLFEIKFHGLPKRKKRELETTLREFAATLGSSPTTSSSQQKKSSRDKLHSGSGSKHASSSSGSHARPIDSAYASMSTGANSSGASRDRQHKNYGVRSSEQKVESYLRDIPEGLYPKHVAMTDKDRKKVVVRRLEHLFTGKITGRQAHRQLPLHTVTPNPTTASGVAPTAALSSEATQPSRTAPLQPQPSSTNSEPAREARILPPGSFGKKSNSRENGSASHSNGDQTESTGNGSGNGGSPPDKSPPGQRPTRPNDLDPDRTQVPADNMEYIRHLGLVPPELLPGAPQDDTDVAPDAEGWVYLNLLCNLAQLHMINVTPDFVRAAVTEISTKFQLSPDGRKIRWRGGSDGTKLTSDSSADSSQNSERPGGSGSKNAAKSKRKRQKTGHSTGDSGTSSKDNSKFGRQVSVSSDSFHYKPLFVRQDSPNGLTSLDDTLSSFGPVEDSNLGESRYNLSGSGSWNRKKRRRDGAVIYYSGAPFCTDLSGDPGDASPTAYMKDANEHYAQPRPAIYRSPSGSTLSIRPLSNPMPLATSGAQMGMDEDADDGPTGFVTDSSGETSDVDVEFGWSEEPQYLEVHPLEPCGLGGVLPDDHFMVVVTTKRPKKDSPELMSKYEQGSWAEATDGIIARLATMSTSSPAPPYSGLPSRKSTPGVEIEYTSGRIKRLAPVPLPPPVIFFPPFSSDDSYEQGDFSDSDQQSMPLISEGLVSRRGMEQSDDYPDGVDLSSGDEEGDDPDDESGAERMYDRPENEEMADEILLGEIARHSIGSSVAAAGTPREIKSASSSDDDD